MMDACTFFFEFFLIAREAIIFQILRIEILINKINNMFKLSDLRAYMM